MGIDQTFAVIEILESGTGPFEDHQEINGGVIIFEAGKAQLNRFLVGAWSSMLNNNT
jgi:hypothetical protein